MAGWPTPMRFSCILARTHEDNRMTTKDEAVLKAFHDHYKSLNEARFADAREAIRAAMLINGGSATATLGFAAGIANRTNGVVPHILAVGLVVFAFGVALAAFAALSAYLANSNYAVRRSRQMIKGELPNPDEAGDPNGNRWSLIALLCAVLSILAFLIGAIFVAQAIYT